MMNDCLYVKNWDSNTTLSSQTESRNRKRTASVHRELGSNPTGGCVMKGHVILEWMSYTIIKKEVLVQLTGECSEHAYRCAKFLLRLFRSGSESDQANEAGCTRQISCQAQAESHELSN